MSAPTYPAHGARQGWDRVYAADDEPTWRTARYGPVHAAHDPGCVLDPRHHVKTACVGWAEAGR